MSSAPSSEVVPKPWGCEYRAFGDEAVEVWYLHLRKDAATSWHLHLAKTTLLIVREGRVRVNNDTLGPGELKYLPPGMVHRTYALEDSWVVEIETPANKGDLVRLADNYGREGAPYESKRLPLNGYEYPSKAFP